MGPHNLFSLLCTQLRTCIGLSIKHCSNVKRVFPNQYIKHLLYERPSWGSGLIKIKVHVHVGGGLEVDRPRVFSNKLWPICRVGGEELSAVRVVFFSSMLGDVCLGRRSGIGC